MGCYECLCNFCANSCELEAEYITAGECDLFCYNCDECRHYDGDLVKRSRWTKDCPHYKEAQKHAENRRRVAEKRRKDFVVLKGGKERGG